MKTMVLMDPGNMEGKALHKMRDIFVHGAIAPSFVSDSIAKHSTRQDIGAHEIFLGQVRADSIEGKNIHAIEYTAYREMANEQMTGIREAAFAKWPQMTCLHVHHSLGVINAGELCFMVFASARHRQQAREAVAFVTDEVKKQLPIFGKELLDAGGHVWKSNI
jgi:molybdopterin synthase catalytic subunit